MELIYSHKWARLEDETNVDYHVRILLQRKQISDAFRSRGKCYMVKFGTGDIRPMWEDQIDIQELTKQIPSPTGFLLDCPLCQPYDCWDILLNKYNDRRYLTKIINPSYPDGFADIGGVWCKCVCLTEKGERRRRLKFICK